MILRSRPVSSLPHIPTLLKASRVLEPKKQSGFPNLYDANAPHQVMTEGGPVPSGMTNRQYWDRFVSTLGISELGGTFHNFQPLSRFSEPIDESLGRAFAELGASRLDPYSGE